MAFLTSQARRLLLLLLFILRVELRALTSRVLPQNTVTFPTGCLLISHPSLIIRCVTSWVLEDRPDLSGPL